MQFCMAVASRMRQLPAVGAEALERKFLGRRPRPGPIDGEGGAVRQLQLTAQRHKCRGLLPHSITAAVIGSAPGTLRGSHPQSRVGDWRSILAGELKALCIRNKKVAYCQTAKTFHTHVPLSPHQATKHAPTGCVA